MRGAAAVTLACSAVPAAAQQREVKPTTNTAPEASVGIRSVTGTVKKMPDNGIVVMGRETGKKDREWAFVLGSRHAPGAPVTVNTR